MSPLWFYRNLNSSIQLILEDVVGFFDVFQLIAVGDQWGGIDFALFDQGEDFSTVAAVTSRF